MESVNGTLLKKFIYAFVGINGVVMVIGQI